MNCSSPFFSNLISLIPDEQYYQLTAASSTGWYVLYSPSSSIRQSTPIPIYHISGTDLYSRWTTAVPLHCQGNVNYPTGKCELVYTRVEEAPTIWSVPNQPQIHKTEISLVGRTVKPKVCQDIFNYPETYCFYTTRQERNPVFLDIIEKWNLGYISYRQIPGQVLVSEKTFGTPIVADLRTIGKYKSILESYSSGNQLDENGLSMPEVVEVEQEQPKVIWVVSTQTIGIYLNGYEGTIFITASNAQLGAGAVTVTGGRIESIGSRRWDVTGLKGAGLLLVGVNFSGVAFPISTVLKVVIGNQIEEISI